MSVIRYIVGFAVLLAFWGAGEVLSRLLWIPVPGSVIGMILLTTALHLRALRPERVRVASEVMIRYMALFFVPPGVAVVLYLDLLGDHWLALVVGGVVGTLAVLLTVGLIQQRMERDHD